MNQRNLFTKEEKKKDQKSWQKRENMIKVAFVKPERQKRSERIMVSRYEAISTNMSIACPISDRKIEDDNSAADKGKNPLSCLQQNIRVNFTQKQSKHDYQK